MDEIIFELKDIHYSYLGKFPALRGVDLDVVKGSMVSVIGANGTGKSTLLQILDALIYPQKGQVMAFGREIKEDTFRDEEFSRFFRSKVGLVFQNSDVQLFCPTVKEDIVFGPLQLGVEHGEIRKRLDGLVESFGIKDLLERSPHQLSVGEKRKVAIASTLAMDPDVLLLDEPTAGLDPATVRHIIDILLDANSKGKTIITATHDLHILEEISDVIHVFNREKCIAKSGFAQDILADAELLEANNLVHIHKHRHKDKVHVHHHDHRLNHHHEEHS
jgi:cobalt/nickel transport system ATP-binding protein